jgi:hypothetical protein
MNNMLSLNCSAVRRGKSPYISPCVQLETEVLLENDLLGASIVHSSWVKITGQGMSGLYFEEDAIVTDDNYWGE